MMPLGTTAAEHDFNALDDFTRGYIEALFFTNSGNNEDELNDACFSDFADETLVAIMKDCDAFQAINRALLISAVNSFGYGIRCAGNDYWYTRNGHGTGFWDRDLESIGDALTAACENRETDAYVGDDGKIYLS